MPYAAPLTEQLFAYDVSCKLAGRTSALPDRDLLEAILDELAKFSERWLEPLDALGDKVGAQFDTGTVTLPQGFADAYQVYIDAGWASLSAPEAFGGQAMPFAVSTIMQEQFSSANIAFSLCMTLSQGAITALDAHGSDSLRNIYLPPMVAGRWTGTMNLTEPQSGSDLSGLRSRATPAADGTYRIVGSKIFITWGDHDLAENVIHLVLARLPDAPPGTKGISLFLVPKFIPDEAGQPGQRNDVSCAAIEHKLGIHASPTCTMSFGDEGECIGWLVGEPNGGLAAMFTMMNHARINIGLQGIGIAETACQKATAFARERIQSAVYGAADKLPVPIIGHADVRRMLMTMRALTDAARAIAYFNAAAVDAAHLGESEADQSIAQGRADLITPITKAFSTDMGVEVASLAVQVFGGMGFIEETGIARHYRDARIAPIYEGTNGIQALDLTSRKLRADNGAHCERLLSDIRAWLAEPALAEGFMPEAAALLETLHSLEQTTRLQLTASPWDAAASATPFLRQFALVLGGVLLLRQALHASECLAANIGDARFLRSKIVTTRFFIAHLLPQCAGCAASINAGGGLIVGNESDLFWAGN